MIQSKDAICTIKEVCRDLPVAVAYVYGSYAAGNEDQESDLDVALLADENLDKKERRNLRMNAIRKLQEKFNGTCPDIDAVILHDVPELLRYNVVRLGLCAYERTPGQRVAFETRAERDYEDEKPYLERELTITVNKVLAMS